jgi:acetyl/propionyl-CoA carboxylase alpha subunit
MTIVAQTPIKRLLIANRGEISSRIIRTCKLMGITTIAAHSNADQQLPFVQEADLAINIGGNTPTESYLDQDKIIQAALKTGADAIHPGFGFLSENHHFVEKVEAAGLIFVGPSAKSIYSMGDKSESKRLLKGNALVPLIPGYEGEDQTMETLVKAAIGIGFPVLIKASAGGGGKGMRIVEEVSKLEESISQAQSEALSSFGNANVLIEKYFDKAKHIEVQIFGDKHGNLVHCYERECSMQRRFQKVLEEAPSPSLNEAIREKICQAALAVARTIDYYNAGTVEFIYDSPTEAFYFLEVNTRLQVEHPVTEEILGIDLVKWQLEVAQGMPLPVQQSDLKPTGHAIEARLYAEDANNNFMPSTGKIDALYFPKIAGMRYESGVESGSIVDIYYDPMIAKIIAQGNNRIEATARLSKALGEMDWDL